MKTHISKFLLYFGLIGTSVTPALASNPIVDNPDNRSYFSVRTAMDLTIPGDFKYSGITKDFPVSILTSAPGISLGAFYNAPIVANFYVEPGLELYYNTTGIDINALGEGEVSSKLINHKSTRKFGMRVPVTLGYHFDFIRNGSVSLFVGPVLDVAFSNDYYIATKKKFDDSFHLTGSLFNSILGSFGAKMQPVGLGLRTGIGFNFCRNFYFGLSGDIGLLNMIKMPDRTKSQMKISYHENRFMVSIGYSFR